MADDDRVSSTHPSIGGERQALPDTSRAQKDTSTVQLLTPRSLSVAKPNTYAIPVDQERSYMLRALTLQWRTLPVADEYGLSDPQ